MDIVTYALVGSIKDFDKYMKQYPVHVHIISKTERVIRADKEYHYVNISTPIPAAGHGLFNDIIQITNNTQYNNIYKDICKKYIPSKLTPENKKHRRRKEHINNDL